MNGKPTQFWVSSRARTASTDELITPVLLLVLNLALYWRLVLGQHAWSVLCQILLSILRKIQYHSCPIISVLTVGQVLAAVTVRVLPQYWQSDLE